MRIRMLLAALLFTTPTFACPRPATPSLVVIVATQTSPQLRVPACGDTHVLAPVRYHVERVEQGSLAATDLTVVIRCPEVYRLRFAPGSRVRLTISPQRPSGSSRTSIQWPDAQRPPPLWWMLSATEAS